MRCTKCPLHLEGCKTNNMSGQGRFGGILVLGEAPGADEDVKGRPFVGSAGQLLRALLADAGLGRYPIWMTNSCRCRPAMNRKPKIDEIRTCRAHLDRELRYVKPRMIIAMGATPAQAITDNHTASVSKLRGTTGTYQGIPVFFTNHPAAILHDRTYKRYVEEDLAAAKKWYETGCKASQDPKYQIDDLFDFELTVNIMSAAVDLETEGLDPYGSGRIQSIAVATGRDHVFYSRCKCYPGSKEWLQVLDELKNIGCFIFHNAPYDLAWMTRGVPKDHWIWGRDFEDTMIALQLRDEHYMNTSLSHLMPIHCGMPKIETPDFVKTGFPEGWRTKSNLELLKQYNCRDAIGTIILRDRLVSGFENEKVWQCYKWVCENIPLVVKMRHSGIYLNQARLEKLYTTMSEKIRRLEHKLTQSGVNFTSRKSLQEHLFGRLKLKPVKRTKSGDLSTDVETLDALEPQDKSGFITALKEHRKFTKIRDTYCTQMRRWGRVAHPRVFIARVADESEKYGANTGRVTCEGFVNLPRSEEDPNSPYSAVKRVLTSRYGKEGIIVSVDGSQMEMRILADLSADENMMKAFQSGEDLHTFTASMVFGVPIDQVTKTQRQLCKSYNFRNVYGGKSLESIRKTGIEITEEQDAQNQRRYFQRFPGVGRWIRNQHKEAMEKKIVFSPTGRPFHLDNALHEHSKDVRKATNSPIQEAANAFCTEAIKQLMAFIERNDFQAHVVLTVYDSIVSDWHKDSWAKVRPEFLTDQILTKDVKAKFKRLGWDIKVPIEWDLKVGPSLGECS